MKLGFSLYRNNIDSECSRTVLRIIFGPKKDEVTGVWKKLHNEGLHNSYPSPSFRVIKEKELS
jgi:hypothetical protein